MVRTAVDAFGELNVIFNNAGMNRPRSFMDVDEANFDEIVRVNTWGVILCTQEAARQMIAQGSGGKISTQARSPAGRVLGIRPLLRGEVRNARRHAGDRKGTHRARHHSQRLRAGCRRHADVDRAERGHSGDQQPSADADPMAEFATNTLIGRPASPAEVAPFLVYLASPSPTT